MASHAQSTSSLRNNYERRVITERLRPVDKRLLHETRAARLIVEALSDDDLETVSQIIQKLDALKTPELPKLKAAIEQAQAELNKYTAGGSLAKAWAKMKNIVGIDNPVVKVSALASALEKGLSQVPIILKNNGVDLKNVDANTSLAKLLGKVGAKSEYGAGSNNVKPDDKITKNSKLDVPGPAEARARSQQLVQEATNDDRLRNITNQLQKALSPSGAFSIFNRMPYISSVDLAQELIHAPLKTFSNLARRINQGAKVADVVPDMKDQLRGGAGLKSDVETDAAQSTKSSRPAEPTTSTSTTSDSTPTGQQPSKPRGGGAAANYTKARAVLAPLLQSANQDPKKLSALVKRLVDAGLDVQRLAQ